MTDKKISNFEIVTLNYFLTRAFLIGIVFNILINSLKQDSWIVPIISIVPALIFIFFISYIMDYKSDLNITEKILTLFNKKIGIIIIILTNIIVFTISIINFLNMTNFIQSQFLNKTPLAVICILLGITSFYIVSKGISVITRTSNILFYIGFILLVLSFIGLIPTFNIGNIKPMFISSIKDYSKGLNAFFSFNIFPIFLITMIPKNIINEPKTKEVLIASYIISSISMFFIIFQTIATFGYELSKLYEYPEFFVLKHAILIEISSRIESILAIQLILDIFIFSVFSIYFISNSIRSVFDFKKINIIYIVISSFTIIGTILLAKYNMFIDNSIMNYISIVTSIFSISLILIIYIKIKMSK